MRIALAFLAIVLSTPVLSIPECASEGAVNGTCVWNAQSQGNRAGHSFVLHSDGSLTYLN